MYENAVSTVLCVCDDVGFGREWPVCADAVARRCESVRTMWRGCGRLAVRFEWRAAAQGHAV